MKKLFLILLASAALSCQKRLNVPEIDFTVTTGKQQIAVNDTANFTFTGNADFITFWSGETGRRYQFKERKEAEGDPVFSFRSKKFHAQANTLAILVSTNFTGVTPNSITATKSSIAAATWDDITTRTTLPSAANVLASSGNVSLKDYAVAGKPIYFAFKYTGVPVTSLNRWEIDSFILRNLLSDGTSYVIANFNSQNSPFTNYGVTTINPGFVFYSTNNNLTWFNSTLNSQPGIVFRTENTGLTANHEAWAIIGPINLRKVTPDVGVVIKGLSQNLKDLRFIYRYPAPGNYNAVFEAGKANSEVQRYKSVDIPFTVK